VQPAEWEGQIGLLNVENPPWVPHLRGQGDPAPSVKKERCGISFLLERWLLGGELRGARHARPRSSYTGVECGDHASVMAVFLRLEHPVEDQRHTIWFGDRRIPRAEVACMTPGTRRASVADQWRLAATASNPPPRQAAIERVSERVIRASQPNAAPRLPRRSAA